MNANNRWLAAYLAIAAVLLAAAAASAQEPNRTGDAWLYPVVRHARIGAIDADGREIIPAEYDALADVTIENWPQFPRAGDIVWQWSRWSPVDISDAAALIAFSRGGAYGFLNADGSIATDARFERAGPFGRDVDLAPARIDGRWGYIDRRGEFTLPAKFDNARSFYWQRIAAQGSHPP